jgi:hypothetical protein
MNEILPADKAPSMEKVLSVKKIFSADKAPPPMGQVLSKSSSSVFAAIVAAAISAAVSVPAHALDLYAVEGVPASARASSGSEAKLLAIAGAEKAAADLAVSRLVPSADAKRVIGAGGYDPSKFVRGYRISDERVAPQSYSATMALSLDRRALADFLEERGLSPVKAPPDPVRIFAPSEVEAAMRAELASPSPLDPNIVEFVFDGSAHSSMTIEAGPSAGGVRVSLAGEEFSARDYPSAARGIIVRVNDMAKALSSMAVSGGAVHVLVRFDSLEDWIAKERRLSGLSGVKEMRVAALKHDRAQVAVVPGGSMNALLASLQRAGFRAEMKGSHIVAR